MAQQEIEHSDRSLSEVGAEVPVDRSLPPFEPSHPAYADLDHHWYECRVCGGVSLDSDTFALMGQGTVKPSNVMHDKYCPGVYFPERHVYRITRV